VKNFDPSPPMKVSRVIPGELAIKPGEGVVTIVAAHDRQHVTQAVEHVVARSPRMAVVAVAADHAHGQAAVVPK